MQQFVSALSFFLLAGLSHPTILNLRESDPVIGPLWSRGWVEV